MAKTSKLLQAVAEHEAQGFEVTSRDRNTIQMAHPDGRQVQLAPGGRVAFAFDPNKAWK